MTALTALESAVLATGAARMVGGDRDESRFIFDGDCASDAWIDFTWGLPCADRDRLIRVIAGAGSGPRDGANLIVRR